MFHRNKPDKKQKHKHSQLNNTGEIYHEGKKNEILKCNTVDSHNIATFIYNRILKCPLPLIDFPL